MVLVEEKCSPTRMLTWSRAPKKTPEKEDKQRKGFDSRNTGAECLVFLFGVYVKKLFHKVHTANISSDVLCAWWVEWIGMKALVFVLLQPEF